MAYVSPVYHALELYFIHDIVCPRKSRPQVFVDSGYTDDPPPGRNPVFAFLAGPGMKKLAFHIAVIPQSDNLLADLGFAGISF